MMTPNEALVRRYFAEVVDGRSYHSLESLFTHDCQIIRADRNSPIIGIAKLRAFVRASIRAVPEIRTKFLEVVDDGAGRVVVCVSHEARFGPIVITPIGLAFSGGKRARWQAFALFVIRDGLIFSERVIRDEVAILRDIGMIGKIKRSQYWGIAGLFKKKTDGG